MKKHLAVLSLTVAGLCAVPFSLRAADDAPATTPANPPASTTTPPAGGHQGGHMDPAARLKKMTEDLSLSQDQQDKIKAIYEKYGPQMKDLMAKGRENLTEEDKTKVKDLRKSQGDEIAAVLTPDQQAKLKAAMEKHRAEQAKPQ